VDHPKGITVLVLGILSIVCCSPLGIVALVMGNNALKEIDAQPGRYGNRQIVQIGRILGIIGMVGFGVCTLCGLTFFSSEGGVWVLILMGAAMTALSTWLVVTMVRKARAARTGRNQDYP